MTTIFPHTDDESQVDYDLVALGQVVLGFTTKNITTKTYSAKPIIVGNSKRQLKELINYTSLSEKGLVRYYKGVFTTLTPNIFIKDINGVVIAGSANYLAVNSVGNIVNVLRKEYQIKELTDVVDSTAPNKYTLTYKNNWYGGEWQLFPEASALGRFDDVTYATVPYGVFVSFFAPPQSGGFGNTYRILPLDISWDDQPTLSTPLDCNGKSVFNLTYFSQNLQATASLSSVSVDTINYSEANIVCTSNVKVLSISLDINNQHLKFFTLNISGFVGIVNFNAQAEILFENGNPLKINKPDNTYTLIVYKDDVKLKINVLHKNRDMTGFTNG